MYFGFCIVIKGYRNSSEKAVGYFIIKMGGIVVFLELSYVRSKSNQYFVVHRCIS